MLPAGQWVADRSRDWRRSSVPRGPDPGRLEETIAALKADMDEWFSRKRRGRASKVFIYVKEDYVWFLVGHGEPFTRESIIKDGESSSLFYRPEKYDVLVYSPENGDIRMNARSKGEKEPYRIKFGLHLFGDSEFFDGKSKFTLEPLRESGSASITIITDSKKRDNIIPPNPLILSALVVQQR